MRSETPILELAMAVVQPELDLAINVPLSLRLRPGECALIEAADFRQLAVFADLCSGLIEPQSGDVRFLGRDWQELPDEHASAVRGRIGRVFTHGAWVPFINVETNILLPLLHHTWQNRGYLRSEALALAQRFGLPGLPLDRPGDLTPADLDRAALVRAFLGEPLLVLVEDQSGMSVHFATAVFNAIAATCDRGGAVVWLARERTIRGTAFPASQHLRLSDQGLALVRGAA
jgi:ABC-type transporter Mla maintaining outer membrane lipid asymmetry ATPase subunit MlaF